MKMRAPFRYWGGKVRMAPWIIERLPEHDHFIEGCAGSAAVMAIKEPVMAETINDTYGEVVNFFRVLRDPDLSADLIDRVTFTPYSYEEFLAAGALLEGAGDDSDPVERAWAFFVRMQMAVVPGRTGWSFSVRGPSAKKANKPGRWSTMPELLQLGHGRFARVSVEKRPLLDLIDRYDAPGVLILVDPPYLAESRPKSTGASSAYIEDTFDHEGFIGAMNQAKHASFAVTHYPAALYDEGAPWTLVDDYSSHRNIPNSTKGRDVRVERLYVLDRG